LREQGRVLIVIEVKERFCHSNSTLNCSGEVEYSWFPGQISILCLVKVDFTRNREKTSLREDEVANTCLTSSLGRSSGWVGALSFSGWPQVGW